MAKSRYVRKTRDEWDVMQWIGTKWEVFVTEESFYDAQVSLATYSNNMTRGWKITKRRVKIEPKLTATGRIVTNNNPPMQEVSHG